VIGDRYRLESIINRGGMGMVWRAADLRLGRPVAVKVLEGEADGSTLERLDREARTVAGLSHPNIVAVHDLVLDAGVPYLVMELIEGDDLQAVLSTGPLDIPVALEIGIQICAALEAAHAAGVVHRDIKPDNVLLAPNGIVKVCDFGIADGLADRSPVGRPAAPVGTSDYMSPEQAAGGPTDCRSDLYALGCLLYAMLTARPPFTAGDARYIVWQQLHQRPRTVASRRPDVPAELDALIGQLLAKDPDHRPATASEVRDLLTRLSGRTARPAGRHAAAASLPGAVQARASVIAQTRTIPELAPAAPAIQDPRRFRLGPAGIAAVAVGAVAVTALVVALLLAAQPALRSATPHSPPPTASDTPDPTTAPTQRRGALIDDLRAAIQAQTQTGQLDAKKAKDLFKKLNEIERQLANGETGKASETIAELGERIDELHREGQITDAGRDAIKAPLTRLDGGGGLSG
jgi:eukaryotic-like serine/threonine-protein kinase